MVAANWNESFGDSTRIEQLERYDAVDVFASQLLTGLVSSWSAAAVRNVLPAAVPWVALLPNDDVDVFVIELSTAARSAVDLDNLAPVAVLLLSGVTPLRSMLIRCCERS